MNETIIKLIFLAAAFMLSVLLAKIFVFFMNYEWSKKEKAERENIRDSFKEATKGW